MDESKVIHDQKRRPGTLINFNEIKMPNDYIVVDDKVFVSIDKDTELMEFFLNFPQLNEMHNPINIINICNHQQEDQIIVQAQQQRPIQIPIEMINGINIISIFLYPQHPAYWKIYLPQSLLEEVVRWYHFTLGHSGVQQTISSKFWAPGLYIAYN